MPYYKLLTPKVNGRESTFSVTDEQHTVGEDEADKIFLDEQPDEGTIVTVTDPTGPTNLTAIASGSPTSGQFRVDYRTGELVFNSADAGLQVDIDYTAVGSVVLARDVNRAYEALGGPWNIDISKPAASTPDDDFWDGQTSLNGKWTVVAGSAGTVDITAAGNNGYEIIPGLGLAIQVDNAGANVELRQDYILPQGRSIILAVTPTILCDGSTGGIVNNEIAIKLVLNDTDSGPAAGNAFNVHLDSQLDAWRVFCSKTSSTATPDMGVPLGHRVYLRIDRLAGPDYYAFFSLDGRTWVPLGFEDNAAATYSNIWIEVSSSAAFGDPTPIQLVHWIREGDAQVLQPW